jgi:hypothetical protein
MGNNYEFNENILRDIMLDEILDDQFDSYTDLHAEIMKKCVEFIKQAYSVTDISGCEKYIDFEFNIDKDQTFIKVVCNNIVCALWFIGIFPTNFQQIYLKNKLHKDNIIYTFDNKTKRLITRIQKTNDKK